MRISLAKALILIAGACLLLGVGRGLYDYASRLEDEQCALDYMAMHAMMLRYASKSVATDLATSNLSVEQAHNLCDGKLFSWRLAVVGWDRLFSCLDVWPPLVDPWDSGVYGIHAGYLKYYRLKPAPFRSESPRVLAITGPDTAFDAIWRSAPNGAKEVPADAILFVDSSEATYHWMAPGDVEITSLGIAKPNGGFPAGFLASGRLLTFADGEVWLVAHTTPPAELLKFVTVSGAEKYDRDAALGSYVLRKRPSRVNE